MRDEALESPISFPNSAKRVGANGIEPGVSLQAVRVDIALLISRSEPLESCTLGAHPSVENSDCTVKNNPSASITAVLATTAKLRQEAYCWEKEIIVDRNGSHPLLIAERNHWVNMRSPACRDPARDCCGHGQQQRRRCKRLGIVHAHAHELGPDHSSKGHTNGYPDRHPHYNKS
jgi:hypothetical protein